MTSIQSALLTGYLRVRRLLSPHRKLDLDKERAGLDEASAMFKALAALNSQPVDVHGMCGEWLTPPQVEGGRSILYLHGGYYLLGSIESHRNLAANIAAAARARTLIVDYRLAPEHPFPAALEDALTAYHWLRAGAVRNERIVLAGDSAGGGLVLGVLLALRQQGAPLPAAAVCMSPCTDLTMSGETWRTNAGRDVVISRPIADQVRPMYLREHDPCDPLASPLFADLRGLPPLLIQVGSCELVLSDSVRFAERARAAGVDVTLEVWPGLQHVWQMAASFVPEGRQAIDRIGEFIRGVAG